MKRFDKIVASFKTTITKLETLITDNEREASKNAARIGALQNHNRDLDAEVDAARRVSDKLREIIA